jgi:hypothetical protein
MSTDINQPVENVQEIWFKAQRVLRTAVQVGIPAFLTFALVLPMIIDALGLPVDSELRAWLLGLAAGVTAVAAGLSRVMAIPAVNQWLTKIGLGSVPKKAIEPPNQLPPALPEPTLVEPTPVPDPVMPPPGGADPIVPGLDERPNG